MEITILSNRTYLLPSIKEFLSGKNVTLFLPDKNKQLIAELSEVCNLEVVPPLCIDAIASGAYKIPSEHYKGVWATTTTNANTMGAMVVAKLLKSTGADSITDLAFIERFGVDIQDNLDLIAEYHNRPRFGKTPWCKWSFDYETELLKSIGVVEFYCVDHRVEVAAKMQRLKEFLLTGKFDEHTLKFYISDNKRRVSNRQEPVDEIVIEEGVCYVKANTRSSFSIGYQYAPVIIIDNPYYTRFEGDTPFRKTTIAQWRPGHLDMSHLIGELNSIELGHGGTAMICGSSKNSATCIHPSKLIEIVKKYLIK